MSNTIKNIVIVGGGTAGWMAAAALVNFFSGTQCKISLIESESIGTVGVGEATVPHIRFFNQTLGIDENEFIKKTNATYKLGIEFSNWGKLGDAYIHPFGIYGKTIDDIAFHHYWLKSRLSGNNTSISDYAIGVVAASENKFSYPDLDVDSLASKFSYAFHIDASLYAGFLREYSEARGVHRIEGKVVEVSQSAENGFLQSIVLESGFKISGDMFIDCSGFRALLIEKTLKTGFEDWSYWLPCDRAIAVPSKKTSDPLPYTKAIAREAGWQWRIPLQNRTGNGQVYCSQYVSDEFVTDSLLKNLDGDPLANLNYIRFKTGRRSKSWSKNCISVGLSSGFLEPLESTSIYLIQIAITKLIEYFPRMDFNPVLEYEFNRDMAMEYERVRDFLILHYSATERNDTEFWNHVRTMEKPMSLQYKIDLFKAQGHIEQYRRGMFLEPSWLAVYFGQGIFPKSFHPGVDRLSNDELSERLISIHKEVRGHVEKMKSHAKFLESVSADVLTGSWPPASMSLYGVFS